MTQQSVTFRIVRWHGDQVAETVRNAAKRGIDDTMAAGVIAARRNVRPRNRTGNLERSIRAEPARMEGTVLVGRWGSFDVNYAIWQEIGTSRMRNWRGPYLRPAADEVYPTLPQRIARYMDE